MSRNLTVKINVGISGSGKTTWTNEYLSNNHNYVSVNRDSYRYMFRNEGWTENKIEQMISELVDFSIIQALNNKLNVIVDATNLKQSYINHFIELVKYKADIEFNIFTVPLETCIERDKNRTRTVGEKIIMEQYKNYQILIKNFNFDKIYKTPSCNDIFIPLEQDLSLPKAAIFDFDGSISFLGKRNIYDWNKVDLDIPNPFIIEKIKQLKNYGHQILIVTGRDKSCEEKSVQWLNEYQVPFDEIYMRPKNDNRKSFVVKKELFINNIKDKYNVFEVYDDRLNYCKMWSSLGLYTFCIGQGLKNF
jgi:predicted kinase